MRRPRFWILLHVAAGRHLAGRRHACGRRVRLQAVGGGDVGAGRAPATGVASRWATATADGRGWPWVYSGRRVVGTGRCRPRRPDRRPAPTGRRARAPAGGSPVLLQSQRDAPPGAQRRRAARPAARARRRTAASRRRRRAAARSGRSGRPAARSELVSNAANVALPEPASVPVASATALLPVAAVVERADLLVDRGVRRPRQRAQVGGCRVLRSSSAELGVDRRRSRPARPSRTTPPEPRAIRVRLSFDLASNPAIRAWAVDSVAA